VVFNPHYMKMGLTGSEFHTLTLSERVGRQDAKKLLEECRPLNARSAQETGLADDMHKEAARIGLRMAPAISFEDGVRAFAAHALERDDRCGFREQKQALTASAKFSAAMNAAEERELDRMRECVYANRYGYREKRTAFVG
jgi:putative two-component system hydrogenase maturation factor HypX/HoxX